MKKIVLILVISLSFGMTVQSQKKSTIKGNKIITDVYRSLDSFASIEISDNLKVNVTQTTQNGYHLKTDENLVNVVKFDIFNGVLKIYTSSKITTNKELEINLTFVDVNTITLNNEAELNSKGKLHFTDLTFTANDDSEYELEINAIKSVFNLDKSSNGELKLKGDVASLILNDNAYLKSNIVIDDLDIIINKRADMNLTGDVRNFKLVATGSSDIKAKKLKTTFAEINASNSSDIYVFAAKELKIYASGKSDIYVYGNPEIKVDGLNDKSKIIKK